MGLYIAGSCFSKVKRDLSFSVAKSGNLIVEYEVMVDSGWLADLAALRQAQYDLSLPFTITLPEGAEESRRRLVCRKLLRLIPGKRMVCAALWGGQAVVVKFFLDSHKADRYFKRELAGVNALLAAGIKTPPLLFSGAVFTESLPLIIFAEIRPASTLLDLWLEDAGYDERQVLLERVCSTIAEHHKAGLLQSDIHWSNFLFSNEDVYTIDGDAVTNRASGGALGRKPSLANLALFLAEPYPGIDDFLAALWQHYCSCRGWSVAAGEVESLHSLIAGHRRYKVEKFVAKSQRSCTAFKAAQGNGFYSVYDRAYQGSILDELLRRPDEMMAAGEMLKDGNSATVVRLKLEDLDLVVKRYNIKDLKHACKRGLRPSRAAVSWKMGQRLSWWQIATPKPVAMLEKRVLGLRSTAYFISEYVDGRLAYDCLRRPGILAAELTDWSEQFATMLRRLKGLGLTHGDFKATNFLCGRDAKLYLIDLDAMRHWPKPGSAFKRAVKRDYKRLLANWQDMPEIERSFQNIIKNLQSDNF